jgi:hypothetical protein
MATSCSIWGACRGTCVGSSIGVESRLGAAMDEGIEKQSEPLDVGALLGRR